MPSPFPGMDPFIEDQKWRDFHARTLAEMAVTLVPGLRPKYVADVEEFIYVAMDNDEVVRPIGPDVAIHAVDEFARTAVTAVETTVEPVVLSLPQPEEITEHYLVIRNREWNEIVTIVELLSPTNKRSGAGRDQYHAKRENILEAAETHLVEIDLLRGGERMPTIEPLPPGDFYAFVCRTERQRLAEVYGWSLRDRLPTIPIPLRDGDADVALDLQAVFDTVYDRSGYDYALDYRRPIAPPLPESMQDWAEDCLTRTTAR